LRRRGVRHRHRSTEGTEKLLYGAKWYRQHRIAYVKADLLNVAGRIPGGVTI
jgi:hypothetical protein